MVTEPDYRNCLSFARVGVSHFRERAVGLDEANLRLVNVRPVDQVLAGFLTPRRLPDSDPHEAEAEDLPQDSPYEQKAMGFDWLSPLSALDGARITVILDAVFNHTGEDDVQGPTL